MQRLDPVQATERALPGAGRGHRLHRAARGVEQPRPDRRALAARTATSSPRSTSARCCRCRAPRSAACCSPSCRRSVTAEALACEAKREKIDREALERELERARKSRLAYADKTVIPGLYAAASVVLRLERRSGRARSALIGPDAELARPNNPAALALRALCDRLSRESGAPPSSRGLARRRPMHLVMFMKDKQPAPACIDGDDIVDINAADRSLPSTLKGILEANAPCPGQEAPEVEEAPHAAQAARSCCRRSPIPACCSPSA